jgi:hypothetical protein
MRVFRDAGIREQAVAIGQILRAVYAGKLDRDVGCVTNWWAENQMGFMVLRSLGVCVCVHRRAASATAWYLEKHTGILCAVPKRAALVKSRETRERNMDIAADIEENFHLAENKRKCFRQMFN